MGKIVMYTLKVMEGSHTTSTCLGDSHDCFVYYAVGTQWDTMDIFLFEISVWLGTLPFILVPVTRSTVFPSLGEHHCDDIHIVRWHSVMCAMSSITAAAGHSQ